MVRLGDELIEDLNSPLVTFQFQYGAIGSQFESSDELLDKVSIPVWCDWEKNQKLGLCQMLTRFNSSMVRLGGSYSRSKNNI